MTSRLSLIATLLPILFTFLFAQSPENPANDLEVLLSSLRATNGELLYPEVCGKFADEIQTLKSGTLAEETDRRKEKLASDLRLWISIAERAQNFLANALFNRSRAMELQAPDFAAKMVIGGDALLRDAADCIWKDKQEAATQKMQAATVYFQKAQLISIRDNLIGQARILLRESADLKAETIAPNTYARTSQLLEEVTELCRANRFDDVHLYEKGSQLLSTARHLLKLAQVIQPIYQSQQQAETFLVELEEAISALGKEMNYMPEFSEGVNRALQDMKKAAQNLELEKNQLEQRNLQLEMENEALQKELQRYQNPAEQRSFWTAKIRKARDILGDQLSEKGGYLVIRSSSTIFQETREAIALEGLPELNRIGEALSEFRGNPVLVRLTEYSTNLLSDAQKLASRRAQKVAQYLQEQVRLPRQDLGAIGLAYPARAGSDLPPSQLEILIDLKAYLSFDVDLPSKLAE